MVGKTPWRREWKRTPVFLLGQFHEQRNWQATVHGVTRSRTKRLLLYFLGSSSDSAVKNPPAMQEAQETWVKSLGWEDALEKGMAIHTSILAWRIPWTKEPDGLQSIGFQRIDAFELMDLSSSKPWNSPGKNTRVDCHALL